MGRRRKTGQVVVLNASMEPLGIVTLGRAMAFLLHERAVVVDAMPGVTLRSQAAEYPLPRVVQLREMVRVPVSHRVMPWTRQLMLQRDGYVCAYCGRRGATVDHVLPRSRGGGNTWENTVTACARCNNTKGDSTPEECGMPLRYRPRVVTRRDTLIAGVARLGVELDWLLA